MNQCPKCGEIDPPYWRRTMGDFESDIIALEDFKHLYPELASRLIPGIPVEEGYYAYRLVKTKKYVARLWLPIFNARGNTFTKPKALYDSAGRKYPKAQIMLARSMGNWQTRGGRPSREQAHLFQHKGEGKE